MEPKGGHKRKPCGCGVEVPDSQWVCSYPTVMDHSNNAHLRGLNFKSLEKSLEGSHYMLVANNYGSDESGWAYYAVMRSAALASHRVS